MTGATGTVAHDIRQGSVFYHTSVASDFTANITNVPTTNNRTTTIVIIIEQGSTAYLPTVIQVDGTTQTVAWNYGTSPTGSANKKQIVAITLIRLGGAWSALGSFSSFG